MKINKNFKNYWETVGKLALQTAPLRHGLIEPEDEVAFKQESEAAFIADQNSKNKKIEKIIKDYQILYKISANVDYQTEWSIFIDKLEKLLK